MGALGTRPGPPPQGAPTEFPGPGGFGLKGGPHAASGPEGSGVTGGPASPAVRGGAPGVGGRRGGANDRCRLLTRRSNNIARSKTYKLSKQPVYKLVD